MPCTVNRTVYCREDRCFHFVSKMKGFACILTFEKCRDFFENSNGKCAKGSLYKWKTKHLLGEYPFTCWVKALFTHGVEALFTRVVKALFTQVVKALFTQVVNALFTQEVHAFRGKMTMKMPWNKPWFFAVFQHITRAGRKYRKNRACSKSRASAKQRFFLLYVITPVAPDCRWMKKPLSALGEQTMADSVWCDNCYFFVARIK